MRRTVPLATAAAIFVALVAGPASADLRSGKEKFLHGDYTGAIADLRKVGGKERAAARLAMCEAHLRVGDNDKAEDEVKKLIKHKDAAVVADARVLLATIYRLTGRYAEAKRELEPLAANGHLRARWLLGLTYRDLGQRARAKSLLEVFMNEWDGGTVDQTDADIAFYTAEGARWSGEHAYANDAYREAIHLNPSLLEANIQWGYLLLSKYAIADAEQSFDEVLKIDPHHPNAHTGMAIVKLEQSYDLAAAKHHLDKALAINPRHIPALRVRASLEIDQNRWDAAKATVAEVLAVNPMEFDAHALLATVYWLRDDTANYEATRKKVFAANPDYAEFFHIVARSAVREHRYKEAILLEKEAVGVDAGYAEAMQAIGTGYLRLGDEKEGLKWMRESWKLDEYNARTYNILDLFEDTIPKEYSFVNSKYFKLRYHNDEKAILNRYLVPTLERAYEDMVKRYKFTPTQPLAIELFRDSEHYSVRTVGLPNLGALGVCFGQVITAMSPSSGNINWGMVLWHELSHVFAIQLSNSRVPRWYTEGLSEYETLIARPEWRRENDADLWAAMQEGTLPSVADLNHSFMKPNMQEVVVAYHLSSVTIEYIATTWGFDKLVHGLKLFAQNKETPEVIEAITGLKVAEFDARFHKYLDQRLAPYQGTFRLPTNLGDIKKLEIAAAAAPKDAPTLARLALGHFYDGNAMAAQAAAISALAIDKKDKIALYVSAELALRRREAAEAKKLYLELVSAGGDGFDVRGRLGMIAKNENDVAEAEKQFCAAKKLDPERSYPYMELAELYDKAGRTAESLAELETYVMIEQMQYAPIKKLVDGYSKAKRWDKVRTYGELGVYINPSDGELFLALGEAYLETGAYAKANFTFASALIAKPELRRPALAHIGLTRALIATKKKRAARKEIAKALEFEPANADALALKKQLGR